jgi:hypothetical protein
MDKNEPFYIGYGSYEENKYNTHRASYRRAYSTADRNNLWKKVYNKLNKKYDVEILLETKNYLEILKKEKEFVAFYGRKDNSTGCLTNLTDGGDGTIGTTYVHTKEHRDKIQKALMGHFVSEETKKIQSLAKKGKKMSKKTKEKMSKNHSKHKSKCVLHKNTGSIFKSLVEGCKYFNYTYSKENRAIHKGFTTSNFKFCGENEKDYFFDKYGVKDGMCIMLSSDKVYKSIKEACVENDLIYTNEMRAICLGFKTCKFSIL